MFTRWRGGPATAYVISPVRLRLRRIRPTLALVLVVAILVGPLTMHAAATPGDLIHTLGTSPVVGHGGASSGTVGSTHSTGVTAGGYYGASSGCGGTGLFCTSDANDATEVGYGASGGGDLTPDIWLEFAFAAPQTLASWRLLPDCIPNCSSGGYAISVCVTSCASAGAYTVVGYQAAGTAVITPFPSGPVAGVTYIRLTNLGTMCAGCGGYTYSFEAFAPAAGVFTDYVYNLRAAHPSFARQYRWSWAKTFFGSYTFTDSAHHTIATRSATFVAGTDEPQPPQPPVSIACIPICGHDTYTITVTDSGAGVVVTYDIDSDADGTLIGEIDTPPVLTGATFCYQATVNQCSAIDPTHVNGAVGQIWVSYNFTGGSSTVGFTYHVQLCERALELLPPACWSYSAALGGTDWNFAPGAHTGNFTHNTAHDSNISLVRVYDDVGHSTYLQSVPPLDLSAGGQVVVTPPAPIVPGTTVVCDQLDVLCGIRALFSLAPGAILAGFDTLMTPLRAKQPFATIIGSAPTILAQLARASAAVTSTSSCSGVDLVVPLGVPGLMTAPPVNGHVMPTPPVAPTSIPAGPGRTAGPFTARVLDCGTFESIVGGWTWFPAFRAFMDVAVYAAYGYSQLQRWQPKPQLTA